MYHCIIWHVSSMYPGGLAYRREHRIGDIPIIGNSTIITNINRYLCIITIITNINNIITTTHDYYYYTRIGVLVGGGNGEEGMGVSIFQRSGFY